MAFNKYAKAQVVKPAITLDTWEAIRTANYIRTANQSGYRGTPIEVPRQVSLEAYAPDKFMLSHCTIIASVDTEASTEPLGRQMVEGVQIDRRFADWMVTPQTIKYINNNNDCWERKLLLSTFKTFVGGENYVEHIQIPELSKGKIIDAASRDIGDSIYVDILVATDKKHVPLINAITTGHLQTLSMGCFLAGTPVTMADGTRIPIEEVVPGDMVLTHKGRAREVLNKQIRIGQWGMRRISVTGVPNSIEATDNHPFFVLRPAKVCACGCGASLGTSDKDPVRRMTKRFKRGHDKRILNPNGVYSLEEARQRQAQLADAKALQVEQVRADELAVGDYVIFPKLDVVTESDPSIAKARLLGYFLAEGSFLKHKGKPVEVQFNFSLDEKGSFVTETVQLLREAFPDSQPWTQDRPDRNICAVHVTGRDLVAWFHQHGGEYSHRKRLSAAAMTWSTESHRALLGAWLNGDGSHRADGLSVGTTTSYDLACQLYLLALRCGAPVRMECLYGGKTATIAEAVVNGIVRRHEVTGKLACFNICFPQAAHAALIGVSDKAPRKCAKERHLRALDNMVVFPITCVESFAFEGAVYNMEVEEDNSYQVHGVATHNCQVAFTICTKCGNVAEDEPQLCKHIRYMKGNEFYDALGNKRKIAELCGHVTAEPGSVSFVEASWVANPAFTGAVLRSILSPGQISPAIGERIQVAFSGPTRTADPNLLQKAARRVPSTHSRTVVSEDFDINALVSQDFDFDPSQEQAAPEAAPEAEAPKKEEDPLDKLVGELADNIKEKAIRKLREQMGQGQRPTNTNENQNNTLIHEACKHPAWRSIAAAVLKRTPTPSVARRMVAGLVIYKRGGWKAVRAMTDLTGKEMLALSRILDKLTHKTSMAGEGRVYRAVIATGGPSRYPDIATYAEACARSMGRAPNYQEIKALVLKGRIYECGH